MNLNDFAKEIHENAVAHGFWDEPRPFDELCALMISELSEALEEARAGGPMERYACPIKGRPCDDGCQLSCDPIQFGMRKPEGITVEMADCAIRILDYLGSEGFDVDDFIECDRVDAYASRYKKLPAAFISTAYEICGAVIYHNASRRNSSCEKLSVGLTIILAWFRANDLDFEIIARRKHEYNKSREFRHGKLF